MPKIKQQIIEKLKNTYCRLQPSKIEGVGVFAIRDIPNGTNPFVGAINERWYKFNMKQLKKLDGQILKMIDDFFVIEKDNTVFIPKHSFNGMDLSFYINNSKKPNLITIDDGFTFVTSRKIKKGEELTVAYSTYDEKYK